MLNNRPTSVEHMLGVESRPPSRIPLQPLPHLLRFLRLDIVFPFCDRLSDQAFQIVFSSINGRRNSPVDHSKLFGGTAIYSESSRRVGSTAQSAFLSALPTNYIVSCKPNPSTSATIRRCARQAHTVRRTTRAHQSRQPGCQDV